MGIDISRLGQAAQEQILRKLTTRQETPKRGKYGNRKTERVMTGGATYTFDSEREARRYDQLCVLLSEGVIGDLKLQPQYTLQESYVTTHGERVRAIRYVADFSYRQRGELVVEDVKTPGTRTQAYNIKRKMLQEKHGITVREV